MKTFEREALPQAKHYKPCPLGGITVTEIVWFICSDGDISYMEKSGDCTGQRQGKIGLFSQWTVGRLSFAIEVTDAEKSEILL